MSQIIDPRAGQISASAISALALCPGRRNAELPLPPVPAGEAAEAGTRLHAALAGESSYESLAPDLQYVYRQCIEQHQAIIDQLAAAGHQVETTVVEQRLWAGQEWSGQIDRIDLISGDAALVTDWKSGRVAQGTAATSLQLRAYAVLVKQAYPQLQTIYVALIQPLAAEPTVAQYGLSDLVDSRHEINGIIRAAKAPDAIRKASPDACRWCRAKAVCPEARGEAEALATVHPSSLPALSNEALGDLLESADVAIDLIDALKVEAKARLIAGQVIPGRVLQPGRATRSISDANEAFAKLSGALPPEAFASAAKLSIPQLESALAEALSVKPKEAKAKLNELLGETIQTKTSEPILARQK